MKILLLLLADPFTAKRISIRHRDGAMRVDGNQGRTLGYEPNSFGEWQEQPDFSEPALLLDGAADHWNYREDDDDYYSQPRLLFRLMSPAQQQALFENTARSIGAAPKEIQIRHIRNCAKADPAYGKGVADALGLTLSDVSPGDVESTTIVRGDVSPEAIQKAVSISAER